MPTIHIVFGPLGAGKTTYAKQLSNVENAVCFSIDPWMVDLFGPELPTPLNFQWVMERVKRCEGRIWLTAKEVALRGGHVVLDLGFLKIANREEFIQLAKQAGFETKIYFVHASRETRRERVMDRNKNKGDTFSLEVSPDMFDFMDSQFETATQDELSALMEINT